MKERFLSILLAVGMMLTMMPSALAVEVEDDTTVAEVLNDNEVVAEYSSPNDIPRDIEAEQTLRLLSDITLELQTSDEGVMYGLQMFENTCLDLNGHTLTFSCDDDPEMAVGITSANAITIKSGTIIMDVNVDESDFDSSIICAIFKMQDTTLLDGVEIITSGGSIPAAIFTCQYGTTTLKNCTINVGTGASIQTADKDAENPVVIISGSYKNLSKDDDSIKTPDDSTTIDGVDDENIVVYTSADTTAIIVENGNAYLYDTLQNAVNAVENGRGVSEDAETTPTIILMKTTSEEVTVGTDTEFKITTNGEGVTNSATFKTEDGYEVKVDESGNVSVAPIVVTSVTVSPSTLNLTEGQTSTLTAAVEPTDATSQNVTWSSDNESVATVDSNGTVTAVGTGTVTITVTTADGGKTATCVVTVLAPLRPCSAGNAGAARKSHTHARPGP